MYIFWGPLKKTDPRAFVVPGRHWLYTMYKNIDPKFWNQKPIIKFHLPITMCKISEHCEPKAYLKTIKYSLLLFYLI